MRAALRRCRPPTLHGSTMSRWATSLATLRLAVAALPADAPGQESSTTSSGGVALASAGRTATTHVDSTDHAGVLRAAGELQADIERVSGARPTLARDRVPSGGEAVIVGTLGRS